MPITHNFFFSSYYENLVKKKTMTEVASLLNVPSGSNILSVQQFKGLSLEPPTKDVVSNQKILFKFNSAQFNA